MIGRMRRELEQRFAERGRMRGEAGAFGEVARPRENHLAVDVIRRQRCDVAVRDVVEIAAEFSDSIEAGIVVRSGEDDLFAAPCLQKRVLTVVRTIDRNVDEHLLDGLVKLETPLRTQPIA